MAEKEARQPELALAGEPGRPGLKLTSFSRGAG